MKCNDVMTQFLELDNSKSIPLNIRLHILFCSDCRSEIFNLKKNIDSLAGDSMFKPKVDLTESIMKNIELLEISYDHNISIVRWVAVGLIILLSMFLLPFNNSFSWARGQFGGTLEIPLNIIMGLAITVYAVVFIGTHTKDLNRITQWIGKKLQ
jgi:hypothetical protein